MNRLQRLGRQLGQELRSYWVTNLYSSSKEAAEALSDTRPVASKVHVDEWTALNYSAFWSAVNLIAGDVATTPCALMRRRPSGEGKDVYDDHYLYELLHDSPNPEMSVVDFTEASMGHVLTWGNGYSEIERDRMNRPMALWPLTPNRVRPYREKMLRGGYGPLQYLVDEKTHLNPADVLHVHGLGWDGTCGYSVVAKAREAIGLGIAAEKLGASFFGDGSTIGGVVHVDADITQEQADGIRDAVEKRNQSTDKAHRILVVPGGQRFDKLTIPPDDAQFLETRKFQVTEIARWFGVPPHKIGDMERATFTNIEMQDLDYYKRTLRRWYVRLEKEYNRKLIHPSERFSQFFKYNADAFLRGDIASRYQALGVARDKGIINADEWRDLEDMNPQPGGQGKLYLVQSAQVPLNKLEDLTDADIKAKEKPEPSAAQPQDPNAADAQKQKDAAAEENARDLRARLDRAERALIESQERIKDLNAELMVSVAKGESAVDERARVEGQLREAVATFATLQNIADGLREKVDGYAERQADVQALANQAAKMAEQLARLQDERQAAQAAEREALECAEARAAELRSATRLTEAAQAEQARLQALLDSGQALAESERALARERILGYEQESTRLLQDVSDASARLTASEESLGAAVAAREAAERQLTQMHKDAHAQQTELDQARRDLRAAQEALAGKEREAAELRAVSQRRSDREAATALAHRALVLEIERRMLDREIDGLRRLQANPEKLRARVAQFYEGHEAVFARALQGAVAAHLAFVESPESPRATAEKLVKRHVAESMAQVQAVLDGDAAQFGTSLTAMLNKWDQDGERAGVIADAVTADAIAR